MSKDLLLRALVGTTAALTLVTAAHVGWMVLRARGERPVFTELPVGARAPGEPRLAFLSVGRTTLVEANALLAARGIQCVDASPRALALRLPKEKQEELRAKAASDGGFCPVLSKNPQVRLACDDVDGAQLGDRDRIGQRGRLLLVFDSPELPLRSASYALVHATPEVAAAAFDESVDAFTRTLGEASTDRGGTPSPTGGELFPRGRLFEREWKFADARAVVNVVHVGRTIVVKETLEVPWPVRPDAPTL